MLATKFSLQRVACSWKSVVGVAAISLEGSADLRPSMTEAIVHLGSGAASVRGAKSRPTDAGWQQTCRN